MNEKVSLRKMIDSLSNGKKYILLHQVNCLGVMGAGLAKFIASSYSAVRDDYLRLYQVYDNPMDLLGTVLVTEVRDDLLIASCFGQYNYGRDKGEVYTKHESLKLCFEKIAKRFSSSEYEILIPFKIGCGLANGNWNTVFSDIYDTFCGSHNYYVLMDLLDEAPPQTKKLTYIL